MAAVWRYLYVLWMMCFFVSALAQTTPWNCLYESSAEGARYNFNGINPATYSTSQGIVSVALCDSTYDGVSVWLDGPSNNRIDLGYSNNEMTVSDREMPGSVIFNMVGQQCNDSFPYRVTVRAECDEDTDQSYITELYLLNCFTDIYMISPQACPSSSSSDEATYTLAGSVAIMGVVGILMMSCCYFLIRNCRSANRYSLLNQTPPANVHTARINGHPVITPSGYGTPTVSINSGEEDKKAAQDPAGPQEDHTLCKICFDNKIDTAILECGHAVCCMTCAQKLTTCPTCRNKIAMLLKIYHI
eukprot:TRINITY_DN7261_c0_g1_i1.p1 TRINITY_DN7261_c0_g1~~TRINITY_DN7261_c0_g1_i1.p1  ORF type:complete len:302 (-),score=28.59 TRINITY_DN7261_c0_g1_i1:29-934(-)